MIASEATLVGMQRRWPFSLAALETVLRLREVLRSVSTDPLLANRLALKGGTGAWKSRRRVPPRGRARTSGALGRTPLVLGMGLASVQLGGVEAGRSFGGLSTSLPVMRSQGCCRYTKVRCHVVRVIGSVPRSTSRKKCSREPSSVPGTK